MLMNNQIKFQFGVTDNKAYRAVRILHVNFKLNSVFMYVIMQKKTKSPRETKLLRFILVSNIFKQTKTYLDNISVEYFI